MDEFLSDFLPLKPFCATPPIIEDFPQPTTKILIWTERERKNMEEEFNARTILLNVY